MATQPDPRNGLIYDWASGDNGWGTDFNNNIRYIGSVLNVSVIDLQTTPPGSPADGDTYIPIATATGAWAGQENDIAIWFDTDAVWRFFTPIAGVLALVTSGTRVDDLIAFNGTNWSTNGFAFTF